MIFQRHHSQHRGETSGANSHRLTGINACGQWDQPIGLHACLLGITAPIRLADAPTSQHNFVARLIAIIVRRLDSPCKINARNVWIIAHQPTTWANTKAVFVVHSGIVDRNRHFSSGQLIQRHVLHCSTCLTFVIFLNNQRFEHALISYLVF